MKVGGRASVALAALALTLALALSACGGGGGGGEADRQRGGSQDEAAERGSKDPQEAMLAFARCMREQGVDLPDPQPGERGFAIEVDPGGASAPFDADFREAEKQCRKHLGNAKPPELSEDDERELREAALKHARCMREEGIDMPDPEVDGGGVRIEPGSIDPQDPQFRKAQKQCDKHLREALPPLSGDR